MTVTLLAGMIAGAVLQASSQDALRTLVEGYLAEQNIPGAVVGFVVDGQPDAVTAYGLAEVASGREMTADARFQVGSVTKPITATLVARLAAMDVLSFDDPLSRHLDLPGELGAITLRELASHRSGLPREPINRRNLPNSPSVMIPMSTGELLDGLARTARREDAGVLYSNLGFALLGCAAGAAAGEDYARLVEDLVLEPLGMSSSGVFLGDEPPKGLAGCYWPEDDEWIAREPWRFGSACAFSGLVATAGDLTRFLAAQMASDEAFLTRELRALLHTAAGPPDPESGLAMANGWFVAALPGGLQAIAHGGEVDGHSATIAFLPKLRAGLVVLCNKGGDSAEGLSRRVMGLAMQTWTRGL